MGAGFLQDGFRLLIEHLRALLTHRAAGKPCLAKAAAPDTDLPYEEETLALLSKYSAAAFHSLKTLEGAVDSKDKPTDTSALARFCGDIILPLMEELRCEIDAMEPLIPKSDWPYPTYGDLLFYGN